MNTMELVTLASAGAAVLVALVVAVVVVRRLRRVAPGGLDATMDTVARSITRLEGEMAGGLRTLGERVEGMTVLFTNDGRRGNWGELRLQRTLEDAGLV